MDGFSEQIQECVVIVRMMKQTGADASTIDDVKGFRVLETPSAARHLSTAGKAHA